MRRTWKEIGTKFLAFTVTSFAGTVVDLALHWVLATFVFAGSYWGCYWVAPTISFEVSTLTNFVIAYCFVWKERISQRNTRSFFRHFGAYNAACIGAYLIKLAAMQGLHFLFRSQGWFQDWSLEPVLCNFLGMCLSGIFNFIMGEFVIFNKPKTPKIPEEGPCTPEEN